MSDNDPFQRMEDTIHQAEDRFRSTTRSMLNGFIVAIILFLGAMATVLIAGLHVPVLLPLLLAGGAAAHYGYTCSEHRDKIRNEVLLGRKEFRESLFRLAVKDDPTLMRLIDDSEFSDVEPAFNPSLDDDAQTGDMVHEIQERSIEREAGVRRAVADHVLSTLPKDWDGLSGDEIRAVIVSKARSEKILATIAEPSDNRSRTKLEAVGGGSGLPFRKVYGRPYPDESQVLTPPFWGKVSKMFQDPTGLGDAVGNFPDRNESYACSELQCSVDDALHYWHGLDPNRF